MIELTEKHLAIPRALAIKYGRGRKRLIEELEDAATMALVEAFRSYRPDEASLSTHLFGRGRYACLHAIRRWRRSLKGPRKTSRLPDQFPCPRKQIDAVEYEDLLSLLPEKFRAVVRMRMEEDADFSAIGKRLSVSRNLARRMFNRAIAALRGDGPIEFVDYQERKEKFREVLANSASASQAAREAGVSQTTALRWVKQLVLNPQVKGNQCDS